MFVSRADGGNMKIDSVNPANLYKKIASDTSKNKVIDNKKTGKQDRIEISKNAQKLSDVYNLSGKIAKEIDQQRNESRIERLKKAVSDGKYHISSEEIADSILGKI